MFIFLEVMVFVAVLAEEEPYYYICKLSKKTNNLSKWLQWKESNNHTNIQVHWLEKDSNDTYVLGKEDNIDSHSFLMELTMTMNRKSGAYTLTKKSKKSLIAHLKKQKEYENNGSTFPESEADRSDSWTHPETDEEMHSETEQSTHLDRDRFIPSNAPETKSPVTTIIPKAYPVKVIGVLVVRVDTNEYHVRCCIIDEKFYVSLTDLFLACFPESGDSTPRTTLHLISKDQTLNIKQIQLVIIFS